MPYDIENRRLVRRNPYESIQDPCGDGKGIYFPRSVATDLGYLCVRHDAFARGLEEIAMSSGGLPEDVERAFRDHRCEVYKTVAKWLLSVPYYTRQGGQLRLVCPPECLEKGPLKRKRKSKRVPKT